MSNYRNPEHYYDPTASLALEHVVREEKRRLRSTWRSRESTARPHKHKAHHTRRTNDTRMEEKHERED